MAPEACSRGRTRLPVRANIGCPAEAGMQPTGDPSFARTARSRSARRLRRSTRASGSNTVRSALTPRPQRSPVLISFCHLGDPRAATRAGRAPRSARAIQEVGLHGHRAVHRPAERPVAPNEHWQQMRAAIGAMGLPYAAGFGERVTYTQLRYGFIDTPAAYLVDADGKLVWSGAPKAHEASLRAAAGPSRAAVPFEVTSLRRAAPCLDRLDSRDPARRRDLARGHAAADVGHPRVLGLRKGLDSTRTRTDRPRRRDDPEGKSSRATTSWRSTCSRSATRSHRSSTSSTGPRGRTRSRASSSRSPATPIAR